MVRDWAFFSINLYETMRTDKVFPDWLEDVWAKSPDKGISGHYESLSIHTFKVLQKLSELIALRPTLPQVIDMPNLWNILFWSIFLHDFGKSANGFQKMLRNGKVWGHRHEVFSVAFLDWIKGFCKDEYRLIASTILSHHKEADELFLLYPLTIRSDEDPIDKVISQFDDKVLEGLWRWLDKYPNVWINALGLNDKGIKIPQLLPVNDGIKQIKQQGSSNIRYWLKSYRVLVKELSRTYEISSILKILFIRGHALTADHMASAHVDKLPKIACVSKDEPPYLQLGLTKETLYAHQKECSKIIGSVILIAPTGSGKTESALLWALTQGYNGAGISRLFYTLPYQASMNAMYERLDSQLFSGQVGLEHSKNILTLYRFLIEDDFNHELASKRARWLKDLVRLNYYPVKVLSPYQILKAFYRTKGYEAIFTDFAGACFILDEIHAYEPERLGMILCSVKFLKEMLKAKFFVMSATLPMIIQKCLLEALGDAVIVNANSELFKKFTRHKTIVLDGDLLDDCWIDHICKKAGEYNSILICCNTVKRAQQAYLKIKQKLGKQIDIILIHSRFNIKDRVKKETAIKKATGSRSEERKPLLLVSTQVIEVSMDIDLDVIFTDPSPLEALIQRFGRINRRRLKSWAPVFVFTKPDDGQGIYDDRLVKKAIEILKTNHDKTIDEEAINSWLDEIYRGDIYENWIERYAKSYKEFYCTCVEALKPCSADEMLENMFYEAFDAIEVLPSNLEENFNKHLDENPLEASQLLVPIRWRQLMKLKKENKVRKIRKSIPIVIETDYDSEFGLKL